AKQALQDGLGGWFPAACVVLAKALDDAEKRAAPQAEPSDEEIDAIAASMPDGAGGMLKQWGYRQFARALLARYGQPAASVEPSEVDMDEYQAMLAVMEQIDPATFPGLTAAQRCALSRFAKPLSALPQRSAGE
ncbi:MAG TPA: hypothetical protein VIK69_09080, partial [Methylophilaceae bacterium]